MFIMQCGMPIAMPYPFWNFLQSQRVSTLDILSSVVILIVSRYSHTQICRQGKLLKILASIVSFVIGGYPLAAPSPHAEAPNHALY